ncbi:MAG: invasin domain 3-containing protein [Cyanobacteria bacterium P01_A01_bin.105]
MSLSNHYSKVVYLCLLASSVSLAGLAQPALSQAENVIPDTDGEAQLDEVPDSVTPIYPMDIAPLMEPVAPGFSPVDVSPSSVADGAVVQAESLPDLAAPEMDIPEVLPSEVAAPEMAVPEMAAPGATSEAAMPEGMALESAVPESSAPESSVPDTGPGSAVSQAAPAGLSTVPEILNPTVGTILEAPAATVIIRFQLGDNLSLQVNDRQIDPALVGRTETNETTGEVIQTWYGVALDAGENAITLVNENTGAVLSSVDVSVRGTPTELRLSSRESGIPADGRSVATVQGQLVDDAGNLSNWDSVVTLTATDGAFIGADQDPERPGFQVRSQNGRFTAELQSSLETGTVQLEATVAGLEAYNQVRFLTPQRPSIATGLVDLRLGARGTDFYSSFRDFLPLDEDYGYDLDLDAALFATGSIGEWLFTGAYNSDRRLNEDCRGEASLFGQGTQNCLANYPTYGDDASRNITAPSIDSVYLRFERNSPVDGANPDYAMWGDFNTEEFANTSQLFTATSRQLHGFKLNYNLGDLAVTGLYGNNIEGFQRDTLVPDGTSGFYFLSRRLLIAGTEEVFIEVEELDRPGTVLERRQLFRGADYQIDYDRGTLLFEDPVFQTSVGDFGTVLVQRIVTTYQFESADNDTNLIAGRLQYNLDRTLSQESWLGTSYLRENQGNRNFELYGADAQISFGDSSQLIAEIAHSSNDFELSGPISGTAYRLELDGDIGDSASGRVYWRSTDAGFSNGATTSFVPGQTRYGATAEVSLGETTQLRGQYDHEDNFGTAPRPLTSLSDLLEPRFSPLQGGIVDNSLTTYSLGLVQQLGDTDLEVDWFHRDRTDRVNPGQFTVSSDQLRTRLTTRIDDRLTVRAQNELNLSSGEDPIYPSRTLFGLDYRLVDGLTLSANQIFYGGNGLNGRNSITTVDLTGEHSLGPDTTIRGRFSSIGGQQLGGGIGVEHGLYVLPGLRVDLGYEHVFNSITSSTAAGAQFVQPFTPGDGASSLTTGSGNTYTLGVSYTDNPDLQASARLEHRTSSSRGDNTVFQASALGRLSPALTVLFDYQLANVANQNLRGLGNTSDLKLGLAFRDPNDDRVNGLVRYEHRLNPSSLPTNALFGATTETDEHLLTAEVLYAPNWQWELYGKYGFRTSSTTINRPAGVGGDFVSSNSVHLAQMRAMYRFAYSWDVVGEARWIGGPGGYGETGFSLEAGYYPTPDLRVYAGYSGGGAEDRDFGVNRSSGGFYLGVAAKLNGLFNGFGLQDVVPVQQAPSLLSEEAADAELLEADSAFDPANELTDASDPADELDPAGELADELIDASGDSVFEEGLSFDPTDEFADTPTDSF